MASKKCSTVGEGEFKLILPLFDNSKNKIKPSEYKPFIDRINNIFGGSSAWRVGGCVIDEGGKEQCEGNVIVTAVRDFQNPYDTSLSKLNCVERRKKLTKDYQEVQKIAEDARKAFGQQSILAVFDNIRDAYFAYGKKKEKISKKMTTKEFEPFKEIF